MVDGEPVTIIFRNLRIGLKVAVQLQKFELVEKEPICSSQPEESTTVPQTGTDISGTGQQKVIAQVQKGKCRLQDNRELEHVEQLRYARAAASFALQQPMFVDVFMNQCDHRVQIPSQAVGRTLTAATDQKLISELLQLQPQNIQHQVTYQQHSYTKTPIYPPVIQVPQIPMSYNTLHTTQQTAMQNAQVQLQMMQINEEITRGLQRMLIQIFEHDPSILVKISKQMGITMDKPDQQQLGQVVKSIICQFQKLNPGELIQKVSEQSMIAKETKEAILNNIGQLMRLQNIQNKNPVQAQLQMQARIKSQALYQQMHMQQQPSKHVSRQTHAAQTGHQSMHPTPLSVYNRMLVSQECIRQQEQAQKVIVQLQPGQISKLVNQAYVQDILKTYGSVGDVCRRVIAVPDAYRPLPEVLMEYMHSGLFVPMASKVGIVSELATKLIQINNFMDNHRKFIRRQGITKFHAEFTVFEKLAILLLAAKASHRFDELRTNVLRIVQVQLFEKLNSLVRSKGNLGQQTRKPADSSASQQVKQEVPNQPAYYVQQDFREQMKAMSQRVISKTPPDAVAACIVLLLGIGDGCNLDTDETQKFIQSNISKLYAQNRKIFQVSYENIFAILSWLARGLVGILQKYKSDQPKQIAYCIGDQEEKPTLTEFYRSYIELVGQLNSGCKLDEDTARKYYFLNERDITEALDGYADNILPEIQRALAVVPDLDTLTRPSVEKKMKNVFGVERSETNSDEM